MGRQRNSPVNNILQWLRRKSMKLKIILGAMVGLIVVVLLKISIENHNHFFIASETVHVAGIIVLVYKITTKKTCSGLSLRSQELTAMFIAVRLWCSMITGGGIRILLQISTLTSTIWVLYKMRFKLKSTYIKELDNIPSYYYLICPCILLSILVHPYTGHGHKSYIGFLWAFSTYLESVSVLPQLHFIRNAKMVEPFTAHYVFALGVSRFFQCAHWIIQIYESGGRYIYLIGSGYLWVLGALFSEIVQTFILADFCYYYIKSYMKGQHIMRIPV